MSRCRPTPATRCPTAATATSWAASSGRPSNSGTRRPCRRAATALLPIRRPSANSSSGSSRAGSPAPGAKRYVGSTASGTQAVPAYTTANNGQILEVVAGAGGVDQREPVRRAHRRLARHRRRLTRVRQDRQHHQGSRPRRRLQRQREPARLPRRAVLCARSERRQPTEQRLQGLGAGLAQHTPAKAGTQAKWKYGDLGTGLRCCSARHTLATITSASCPSSSCLPWDTATKSFLVGYTTAGVTVPSSAAGGGVSYANVRRVALDTNNAPTITTADVAVPAQGQGPGGASYNANTIASMISGVAASASQFKFVYPTMSFASSSAYYGYLYKSTAAWDGTNLTLATDGILANQAGVSANPTSCAANCMGASLNVSGVLVNNNGWLSVGTLGYDCTTLDTGPTVNVALRRVSPPSDHGRLPRQLRRRFRRAVLRDHDDHRHDQSSDRQHRGQGMPRSAFSVPRRAGSAAGLGRAWPRTSRA